MAPPVRSANIFGANISFVVRLFYSSSDVLHELFCDIEGGDDKVHVFWVNETEAAALGVPTKERGKIRRNAEENVGILEGRRHEEEKKKPRIRVHVVLID